MELKKKEEELSTLIEKYNNLKMEFQDQLDGKSDVLHNTEDEYEKTISILRQQINALENKLTMMIE